VTPDQPPVLARPSTIPYITRWTGETAIRPCIVPRPALDRIGIGYDDEVPGDRDAHGILWSRPAIVPTIRRGRPEYGFVHPRRQRRCATRLLCQVCGGPASRTELGVLWLIGEHGQSTGPWPEGIHTSHPPVCLPCATAALRECPHIAANRTALRVQRPQPYGVIGTRYAYNHRTVSYETDGGDVAYDDARRVQMIADQMVISLSGCTVVDLHEELRRG
jgi:hypothetical protein